MVASINQGGVWKRSPHITDRVVGKSYRRGWEYQSGIWRPIFQDEVVATITSGATQISAQNYFTAADWANPLLIKRLVIATDMTVGSFDPAIPAMTTGTGRSGKLIIENNGYILGMYGRANSGVGGDALQVDEAGVTLINNLGIYAGGGGGGRGGNGGPGYYTTPRTVTEGPIYTFSSYFWADTTSADSGPLSTMVCWAGSWKVTGPTGATSLSAGGYVYHRGAYAAQDAANSFHTDYYKVYRTHTVYDPHYTTGGFGGQGGHGTGHDLPTWASLQPGTLGAAGGTNAGAGGKGGDGGPWGEPGKTGNNGAAGNNGPGLAGAAGGLGGFWIKGQASLDQFINNGSVLGRAA